MNSQNRIFYRNILFEWFKRSTQVLCLSMSGLMAISCGNSKTSSSIPNYYEVDTVNIKIDDSFLGVYSENDIVISSSNESHWFFGLNAKKHQIDIIDLLRWEQHDPIILEKAGPNGILGFENFVYYKDMFVFWKSTSGELFFIDWQGKIIDKYNLKSKLEESNDKLTFQNSGGLIRRKGLHRKLQVIEDSFILPIYYKGNKNEASYYLNPFFATFNSEKNLFRINNAQHPSELTQGNFHGDHDQFSVFSWDDEVYLNFGFSPNIFLMKSDKLSEIIVDGPNSFPLTQTISWTDYNLPQNYIPHFDGYQFGTIKTDQYRRCLIRPHKISEFSDQNFIRPLSTEMILTIIDPKSWNEKTELVFDFYNPFSISKTGLTIPVGFNIIDDMNYYTFILVELDTI